MRSPTAHSSSPKRRAAGSPSLLPERLVKAQHITQHDVNMLLNQRPGKLQTKDIKVRCAQPTAAAIGGWTGGGGLLLRLTPQGYGMPSFENPLSITSSIDGGRGGSPAAAPASVQSAGREGPLLQRLLHIAPTCGGAFIVLFCAGGHSCAQTGASSRAAASASSFGCWRCLWHGPARPAGYPGRH